MFPASSVQTVRMIMTQLKSTIDNRIAIDLQIEPQIEESMQRLQDLTRDLQERHREGTLRSDRDTFAMLPASGTDPGNLPQCVAAKATAKSRIKHYFIFFSLCYRRRRRRGLQDYTHLSNSCRVPSGREALPPTEPHFSELHEHPSLPRHALPTDERGLCATTT